MKSLALNNKMRGRILITSDMKVPESKSNAPGGKLPAKYKGEYYPYSLSLQGSYDRLIFDNFKRVSNNNLKAIATALVFANLTHDRMYIVHYGGHNFLCNRAMMNTFIKDVGEANVQTHMVKPSYENDVQA